MLKKYGWIVLIAAFAGIYWIGHPAPNAANNPSSPVETASHSDTGGLPQVASPSQMQTQSGSSELPDFIPAEAEVTLDLIRSNGPFPFRQDGVVFNNRERRLPSKPRGYYHEYTVETPGLNHRGARRIITGGNPPEIYYYTDDHYDSFREFEVRP